MTRLTTLLAASIALTGLTACGDGDPRLMNLRNTETGPDEFAVLPTAPLEMPGDMAALPTPTPGSPNRVDPDPEADAIIALGGDPDRAPSGTGSLISHVTRFGVSPDIRGVLAAEDEAFRSDHGGGRLLERAFDVNVYYRAYRDQALDRYAELERLRRAGVRTPTAPPAE